MGKKNILEVRVMDVEKRRYPTKHYVYILEVSWSEGSSTTIFRRYSDFFEFQCGLLEMFPLEAGEKDPTQRMIPFLPGKKLLGRSQTRAVAEKRKEKIDDYCKALIRLPPNISDCEFVQDFFEVRQSDLEKPKKPKPVKGQPKISEISDPLILERYVAIADYEKRKKNECSLVAGQTVEVIDKNENGWWFVNVDDFNEGWVPATYLEPLYGSEDISVQKLDPGEEETWISMNKYEAQHHDEISFEKGVLVEVFEKGMDGWWKIRYQGNEGMAPATYLRRYHGQGAGQASTGTQLVSTVKEVTDISSNSYPSTNKPVSTGHSISPEFSRSATMVPSTPTSPSSKLSLTMSHNVSYNFSNKTAPHHQTTSSTAATHADTQSAGISSSQSAIQTTPTPAPKPANSIAMAAAATAEKQKFLSSWHSKAAQVDEEPIYAPTPRRYSFKNPPLKKRDISSSSSSGVPEPVYEIIPEPDAEIYITLADFMATAGDGISFDAGKECTVIIKNPAGWWYVEMDENEGWVPSSYLERKSISSTPSPLHTSTTRPSEPMKKPVSLKKDDPNRNHIKEQRNDLIMESKKEQIKKDMLKRDVLKDSSRKELPKEVRKDPQSKKEQKNQTSPLGPRRVSFQNKSSNNEQKGSSLKKSSLKRSTSTDSGLNEEITRPVPQTLSPYPVRAAGAPPRPSRPKNTPSLPNTRSINGPKSPRTSHKSTLKPTISEPIAIHVSPIPKRKHDSLTTTKPLRPTNTVESPRNARNSQTKPISRPTLRKDNSDEMISRPTMTRHNDNISTNKPGHLSTSDLSIGGSRESSNTKVHGRRKSDENIPVMANLKSNLEKKLSVKPGPIPPSQQPKRPLPPSRPKAPVVKTNSTGTKATGPPARPNPPKATSVKRPPPPRPSSSPLQAKKTTQYVTVGDYTAEDSDSCLSFKEGAFVEVLEKDSDGWWFVKIGTKEGWAPSTYIEEKASTNPTTTSRPHPTRPKLPAPYAAKTLPTIPADKESELVESTDSIPKPKPRPRPRKTTVAFCRASESYQVSANDGGISIVKGRVYELKEQNDNGWWLVKDGDEEGWAPASYFKHV